MQFLKKTDERRESFLPNTDSFLAVFIVFKWGRIFESTMDPWEVKCNVKVRHYFA